MDRWLWRATAYLQHAGPLAASGGIDWAYWQLGGVQEGGTSRKDGAEETYGILNDCWTAPASQARRVGSPPSHTDGHEQVALRSVVGVPCPARVPSCPVEGLRWGHPPGLWSCGHLGG